MLKIIVVDDETEEHTRVRKIIKPLLFKYEELTDPIFFDGYNDELKSIIKDTSERKIYLLDINLGTKITGLNIASLIREEDWNSEIIFLTNHDNYFEKVYRSCIVNTARVSKYNWSTGDFILDTSEKVPLLSKKYKEKVVK